MKPKTLRLIDELRKNSRRSLTDLGRVTGIPLATVFKKVGRLNKEWIVTKNVSIVDFASIGFPYKAGIFISTNQRDEFKKLIEDHPNVNTLLRLSGDYDFYAEFLFKNMKDCQDLVDEIKELQPKKISIHFITDLRREDLKIGEKR